MPIQYEVFPQDRVLIVTLTGALAVADYAQTSRAIIADPKIESGFALLIDGRELDPLPNLQELRELVQVARDLCLRGIQPFALIAGTDAQLVVGQMFAVLAGVTINLDARVFRSIEIARDWLRVAVASRKSEGGEQELGGPGSAPPTA